MAFVVDNSVTIAWCVSAQANAYSRRVLERSRREAVYAPQVWPFEFLNTLRTLERRAKLFEHQVAGIVTRIARMRLEVDREMVEHRALLELSRRWDLSVYDAAYLELAQRRGLPLATRDASLAQAARAAGIALA